MKFWIGTSGFQYTEWREVFYPAKLPAAKMLPFYAERFQTTEINYTFRRIPSGKTIESWCELTPEQFAFSLKAPQRVTHFAKLQNCTESLNYFFGVIQGLEHKLGPLLFQLPPSFKKDAQVLQAFLAELPNGIRAAFEFRHDSWLDDEIFENLRAHNAALCIADSASSPRPLLRRQTSATCACDVKTTMRRTSSAGRNSCVRTRANGAMPSSTSNMKSVARDLGLPPR
jgi:uncharacterized protein YecE (DUF72 family)